MIPVALGYIFIKLPKKIFAFIKLIFKKIKVFLTFIFVTIPRTIWKGIQKIIYLLKILFIPNYKKQQQQKMPQKKSTKGR